MNHLLFYSALLMCWSLLSYGQNSGPNSAGLSELFKQDVHVTYQETAVDSLITWGEQLMFHFDNPVLEKDKPLFFKAYTLTGPNKIRATLSKVLKVELLNEENEIVKTQYHKIESGIAEGGFSMPKKLKAGSYQLRAYTRWMQNYGKEAFFTQRFQVAGTTDETKNLSNDENIAVSFFPEGGSLVHGLMNRLVVKATNEYKASVALSGAIVDGAGDKVGQLEVHGQGLASVFVVPDVNRTYFLEIENGQKFKLPEIVNQGVSLSINNLDDDIIKVRVKTSDAVQDKKVKVKGVKNGITYFEERLTINGNLGKIDIVKNGLPLGRMLISLYDKDDRLLASRPLYIEPICDLKISLDRLSEQKTDEFSFKVKVTDMEGSPVSTGISLSAISALSSGDAFPLETSPRLNSNMTWGTIEREQRFLKDLVALTTLTDVEDMPAMENTHIHYPFQTGLDLFGYAYDLNNKLLKNSKIQMLNTSGNNVLVRELQTDANGRVNIQGLDLTGTNELVFRADGDETKARFVKIIPIQEGSNDAFDRKSKVSFDSNGTKEVVESSPLEPIDERDIVALSEVEVKENKIERKRAMPATYGIEAIKTKTIIQDIERPKFLFQLLAELPGVMVSGNLEAPSVNLIGNNRSLNAGSGSSVLDQPGPLWIIDGLNVGNFPGIDPRWGLTSVDIDRIELLNRSDWAMYGSRAAAGVIMVYTRNGSEFGNTNRKEGMLTFQGFDVSSDFVNFAQQVAKRPKKYEERNTTLYWNPNIKTDENGEAMIRFDSPIDVEQLEVRVSGITETGKIGSTRIIW